MTNNPDAQIARQWAEAWAEEPTNHLLAAVRRHILATTTPPTMAETAWEDGVHSGLCAEHPMYGVVRMLGANFAGDISFLYAEEGRLRHRWTHPANLTPIPGTKVDLTPRREPEPESTPEFTPDHPEVLATPEDYENAPTGTIVAGDYADPWVKDYRGFWLSWGAPESETSPSMALSARCVLRWGRSL